MGEGHFIGLKFGWGVVVSGAVLGLSGCLTVEQPLELDLDAVEVVDAATSTPVETIDAKAVRSVRVRVLTRHYGNTTVDVAADGNSSLMASQCSGLQISANHVLTAAHCVAADAFAGDQTRNPWSETHPLVTGKWLGVPKFQKAGVDVNLAYQGMTIECPGFRETGDTEFTTTAASTTAAYNMSTNHLVRVERVYVTTKDVAVLYVAKAPPSCTVVDSRTYTYLTSGSSAYWAKLDATFTGSGPKQLNFYGFGGNNWAADVFGEPFRFSNGEYLRGRAMTFGADVYNPDLGVVPGTSMKALLTYSYAMGTPGDSGAAAAPPASYEYPAAAVVSVQVACTADMSQAACTATPTCTWFPVTASNPVAYCGDADLNELLCDYSTQTSCNQAGGCFWQYQLSRGGWHCSSLTPGGSLTGVTPLSGVRSQIASSIASNAALAASILKPVTTTKPVIDVFFAQAQPLVQLPDTGTSMTTTAVLNDAGTALNAVGSRNWDLPAPLNTLRSDGACLARLADIVYSRNLPNRTIRLDHEVKLEFGTTDSQDVPRLIRQTATQTVATADDYPSRNHPVAAFDTDCPYNVKYFNGYEYPRISLAAFIERAVTGQLTMSSVGAPVARLPTKLTFTKAGVLGKLCHIEACSASCTAGCVLEVPYQTNVDKRQHVDAQACRIPADSGLFSGQTFGITTYYGDDGNGDGIPDDDDGDGVPDNIYSYFTSLGVCKDTRKFVLPAHLALIMNLTANAILKRYQHFRGFSPISAADGGFTADMPAELLDAKTNAFNNAASLLIDVDEIFRNGADPADAALAPSQFNLLIDRANASIPLDVMQAFLGSATSTVNPHDRLTQIFATGYVADFMLRKGDVWEKFVKLAFAVMTAQDLAEIDAAYLAERSLWEEWGTSAATVRANLVTTTAYPTVPMVAATERIMYHPTGGPSSSAAWAISSATFGRRIGASSWGRISSGTWRRVGSASWLRIADLGAMEADRTVNGGLGTEFKVGSASWTRISSSVWGSRIGSATWGRISAGTWGRISDRSWGRISANTWGRIGSASWGRISARTWNRIGSASWGRISAGSWGRIGDFEGKR